MFCVLGFTMQCGVNVTTFVLPSAVFRKEVRSTCNGAAAAIGKSGAFIGAYLFPVVIHSSKNWVVIVLGTCSTICVIGGTLTFMCCHDHIINDVHDKAATENLGSLQSNQPSFSDNYPSAQLGSHLVNKDKDEKKNVEMRSSLTNNSDSNKAVAPGSGSLPPADIDTFDEVNEIQVESGRGEGRPCASIAVSAEEAVANPLNP